MTVKHQTADALPFNNTSFATFLTRERRKVLTVVDATRRQGPASFVESLANGDEGRGVVPVRDSPGGRRRRNSMTRSCAATPPCACFRSCRARSLWQKLARYVRGGGGLVLVPGGEEMRPQEFAIQRRGNESRTACPASSSKIETNPPDSPLIRWSGFQVKHAIPMFFEKAIRTAKPDFGKPQSWPGVNAFWSMSRPRRIAWCWPRMRIANIIRPCSNARSERGHVLLFTTPLDARDLDRNRPWHNYWSDSSFGLVLEDQVLPLPGRRFDDAGIELLSAVRCRSVPMPSSLAAPPYTLDGPGLAVAETNVKADEGDTRLSLPQAVDAGQLRRARRATNASSPDAV